VRRRRQRRGRRRGGSRDIGVVADKGECISALARPFVHTPLDVTGAPDLEEDFLLCLSSTITGTG